MNHLQPVLAAPLAALLLSACGSLDLNAAFGVPTAMAAHEICSSVFISGFDPEVVQAATVAPQLGPAAPLLRKRVDASERSVTASLAGLAVRKAQFHGPLGCIIEQGQRPPQVEPVETAPPPPAPVTEPVDPALRAALDLAFLETEGSPARRTYAAVIMRDGQVVAERYAAGVSANTPLHGWSMTKSLTNALLGVLVQQGRLDMRRPAAVDAWREVPHDPRAQITPDDLLRMRSGLDLGQSLSAGWAAPFNIANQIMFVTPDMAAASAARSLAHSPRTVWTYSDGNTAILGALIGDLAGGGDAQATQAFARRELFDPLEMGRVVLETDATGSLTGATQAYASARDWGRLGQLFLNDGKVAGRRILPKGWIEYSTSLTPGSEPYQYGAGFWINTGGRAGMPADSYMARGARGQYLVIIPSARMVIVKLGDADTPLGDLEPMGRFVEAAVAAAGP